MTRFFEVASVSATHIYRSALELAPLSSIVRRLYYHQRVTPSPRAVVGTPDSWQPSVAIHNKDFPYTSCTWSPCGQFIAAQTQEVVEIRDPLTFEILSTLQPTKSDPRLTGPLAYSPNGRSLCCVSSTDIVIWDIQTGGVVKEIEYDGTLSSLVWSLDGRTIGGIGGVLHRWTLVTYDITSGITLWKTLVSTNEPHIWAHEKSLRVMTTAGDRNLGNYTISISISEVGPALTQIISFPILHGLWDPFYFIKSFSPTSHRVSIYEGSEHGKLYVVGDQDWKPYLLQREGPSGSHCFSSDGTLFAASLQSGICVWKYNGHSYTLWREFPDQGWSSDNLRLQFSPTSSSILGHFRDVLQAWHFDDQPTDRVPDCGQYTAFSPHGTYTVTSHPPEKYHHYHPPHFTNPFPVHRHGCNDIGVGAHWQHPVSGGLGNDRGLEAHGTGSGGWCFRQQMGKLQ